MKIPATQCHWYEQDKDNLCSVAFDLFIMKIDDTIEEFGGPRKNTRIDTIIEGLTKYANKNVAAKLVGKKLVVSSSGRPLYITALPTKILKSIPLPKELEDSLAPNTAAPTKSSNNGGFDALASAFSSAGAVTDNTEEKRIAYGGKELFKQIAAYLRPTYSDEHGDLFIFEVMPDPCPTEVASSVMRGGEKIEDKETKLCISWGFQKEIE